MIIIFTEVFINFVDLLFKISRVEEKRGGKVAIIVQSNKGS